MPYNGSGGVTQPASSIYPAVPSTLIESAKFNISIADIYVMLGSVLVKDGQQVATQRIPFASGIATDTINEKTLGAGVSTGTALNTPQGADIVCAATINLELATGNVVDVTGSTGPVTAITLSQGHWRIVRFTGTPTLTNGASLVLPGGTNYTVAAGDYVLFIGYASSVVRAYIFPTNGPIPFVDTSPVVIGSADKTKKIRFEVDGLTTGTTRVITAPDRDLAIGPTLAAKQASTSGTAINFTSIPSGTRRITIEFVGVSTNGTSNWAIQIGSASGSYETSGYLGASSALVDTASVAVSNHTNSFGLRVASASAVVHGSVVLNLVDPTTFTWVASGTLSFSDSAVMIITAGSKSLAAELDRLRITTSGGTDTFDAGSFNISYE